MEKAHSKLSMNNTSEFPGVYPLFFCGTPHSGLNPATSFQKAFSFPTKFVSRAFMHSLVFKFFVMTEMNCFVLVFNKMLVMGNCM